MSAVDWLPVTGHGRRPLLFEDARPSAVRSAAARPSAGRSGPRRGLAPTATRGRCSPRPRHDARPWAAQRGRLGAAGAVALPPVLRGHEEPGGRSPHVPGPEDARAAELHGRSRRQQWRAEQALKFPKKCDRARSSADNHRLDAEGGEGRRTGRERQGRAVGMREEEFDA
ncbi:hypothetical protein PVAP13_9NG776900 [Panicum virgatum]|uniref:Uncharacterized protein n=1 Tax=Panicum virgatum TaxID=38727 RepID=A0A8T0NA64_PANVG|nr:hypothetical protein PVAP13_9NG776900 [Panicum virgatum]